MFIYMPKINFSIRFFLEILHFKESCFDWLTAFWPITRKPEFCQIWDWWRDINNNISFHFRLLPRKNNDKIFQKTENPTFGPFWALFAEFWAKMNFPGKKGSVSFYIFRLSTIVPKIRKNYRTVSEKNAKLTDRQTDGLHLLT